MKKSILTGVIAIIAFLSIGLTETNAWPRYRVYITPKAVVNKPGPNYVWVEGHWKFNKFGKSVWVAGHWRKI